MLSAAPKQQTSLTMPNEQEAKRKILILANRAKKGVATTSLEEIKIDQAVKTGRIKNRRDVSRVLEESLSKSAAEIGTTLASDDSDRLVDEIVNLLEK